MSRDPDLVYVEGVVIAATDKAIQYRLGVGAEVWVPASLLDPMTTARAVGQIGWLVVPRWFAQREKIMRFVV